MMVTPAVPAEESRVDGLWRRCRRVVPRDAKPVEHPPDGGEQHRAASEEEKQFGAFSDVFRAPRRTGAKEIGSLLSAHFPDCTRRCSRQSGFGRKQWTNWTLEDHQTLKISAQGRNRSNDTVPVAEWPSPPSSKGNGTPDVDCTAVSQLSSRWAAVTGESGGFLQRATELQGRARASG
jgi:hypothetical protein